MKNKVFINTSTKYELNMMIYILFNPKEYNLQPPIARIVIRDPDFMTFRDACLETGRLFWNFVFATCWIACNTQIINSKISENIKKMQESKSLSLNQPSWISGWNN